MTPPADLDYIADHLTDLTARILQISSKRARILLGGTVGKLGGVATSGGLFSVVAALGTASNGTAIATLFGAAKTSATLYWLGSLVGGGVATGGLVLAGAGLAGGVLMSRAIVTKAFGTELDVAHLPDEAARVLAALTALQTAVTQAQTQSPPPSREDIATFIKLGVRPTLDALDQALRNKAFAHMTLYQRIRLRGHRNTFTSTLRRIEAAR